MPSASTERWSDVVLATLKANDVRLVTYVPDKILIPLIEGAHADPFFTAFSATREEEALGICAGAWLGGMRSVLMMQTSGFGNVPNALASLAVAYQIPVVLLISERGSLGEFNVGQVWSSRVVEPVCYALGVPHHVIERAADVGFILDRTIKQAWATQQPAALVLSPLLTGGKVFAA
ncbi:MAG TPA: thiamine pyrophosphate-binding protein [Candidatus Sulfotelmatobacter sp.]|nr:thiamine pyrophosphate-binding protein [Candidatus Sulfotelmatobacter sp.]